MKGGVNLRSAAGNGKLRVVVGFVITFLVFHIMWEQFYQHDITCTQIIATCDRALEQKSLEDIPLCRKNVKDELPDSAENVSKKLQVTTKIAVTKSAQLTTRKSLATTLMTRIAKRKAMRKSTAKRKKPSTPKKPVHVTQLITTTKCDTRYSVIVMVSSAPNHTAERNMIRQTWGTRQKFEKYLPTWKTFFVIGQQGNASVANDVIQENKDHGDLILGDFQEHFYNLSLKVQVGFEWSVKYCHYTYLLKTDDDVFVNMGNLFRFLGQSNVTRMELYAGNIIYKARPQRKGKYAVTEEEYSRPVYPRYASGGGFVVSRDVVERMIPHFNVYDPFKIDDAYIGMLALKAGVDVTHSDDFEMFKEDKNKCTFKRKEIIHHKIYNKECMLKLYEFASSLDTFMREMEQTMQSVRNFFGG